MQRRGPREERLLTCDKRGLVKKKGMRLKSSQVEFDAGREKNVGGRASRRRLCPVLALSLFSLFFFFSSSRSLNRRPRLLFLPPAFSPQTGERVSERRARPPRLRWPAPGEKAAESKEANGEETSSRRRSIASFPLETLLRRASRLLFFP